jgi:2Fe-2S ferredoxin
MRHSRECLMGAHLVRVLPADAELPVDEDDDVFWAAHRAGWTWPTVCGGSCECGQCWMLVLDGAEYLSEPTASEQSLLQEGMMGGRPNARLACMTYLTGPIVVRRVGARPPGACPPDRNGQ